MGVVKKFPFPKYVASPTGGWWTEGGKESPLRLASVLITVAAGWIFVFKLSADRERRSIPLRPIPSQRWCKHTIEDDPDYPEKFAAYKASSPSLWSRIKPDPAH